MPAEPFAMIPHRLSEDSRLDIYARDLYRHYATVAGQGYCADSDATIAKAMGVSPRSIRSARYRLVRCGYIRVERRYQNSLKVWPLYVPEEDQAALPMGPILLSRIAAPGA